MGNGNLEGKYSHSYSTITTKYSAKYVFVEITLIIFQYDAAANINLIFSFPFLKLVSFFEKTRSCTFRWEKKKKGNNVSFKKKAT